MAGLVDPIEARSCANRWQLVARTQRMLRRRQPAAARFRQLDMLAQSAIALGWATTDPAEVAQVRARWARLRATSRT